MKIDIDFKEDEFNNQTCCIYRFKELTLDLKRQVLIVVNEEGETVTYRLDEIDNFDVCEEVDVWK